MSRAKHDPSASCATRPSLTGIEKRAEDVRRNAQYGKESRSRRLVNEASAADVPTLTDALRAALAVLSPHWEYQTHREAKFGRTGSSCVCEVCDAMRAITQHLDLTDPEGDPT